VKETINSLSSSVAKSPVLAMMLIIFLVQSYIMVVKLDKINDTLVNIHKDNLIVQQYITNESSDTKIFIERQEEIEQKLVMIWEVTKRIKPL
jgi:glutathione synthase/RimK-type ligase-like ATP-grasp enzyme